jgi:hypothetical protein
MNLRKMELSRDQKIAAVIAVVAVITLIITVFLPETRRILGLDDNSLVWVFDADSDGHAGVQWNSVKARTAPSAPPEGCTGCQASGWKTGIPADDRDDSNPSIYPGSQCTVGQGACRSDGKLFYHGDNAVCKAETPILPEGFRDIASPNGSWDWDCNGTVEKQWATCESLTKDQCDPNTNVTQRAPGGFCTQLRSPGGCPPDAAECGQRIWTYPCFWNAADGRCHAGGYETATTMACK